ncbi:MAG: YbhB/YbcL family Raf kinase inhibitor-like protein [Actinomycetota bacterium]|nr:YbhB/YbcL family Raf kinase inhibitor-like protein [Actinomycetota bacterium]
MPRRFRCLAVACVVLALLAMTSCHAEEPQSTPTVSTLTPEPAQRDIEEFEMSCPALESDGSIPVRFAGRGIDGGLNVSLPFRWSESPAGTRSFALVVVDRNPIANDWVHWVVVGIPERTTSLPENASLRLMPTGSLESKNTFGEVGYGGPQPPAGSGEHTYEAVLYALEVDELELSDEPSFAEFTAAAEAVATGRASTSGTFEQ